MTSAKKAGWGSNNAPSLQKNSIDFADRQGGGGPKIPTFSGRHTWKRPYVCCRPSRGSDCSWPLCYRDVAAVADTLEIA